MMSKNVASCQRILKILGGGGEVVLQSDPSLTTASFYGKKQRSVHWSVPRLSKLPPPVDNNPTRFECKSVVHCELEQQAVSSCATAYVLAADNECLKRTVARQSLSVYHLVSFLLIISACPLPALIGKATGPLGPGGL